MTQEQKDLLLKDLCGRLPYGVKISVNDNVETLQGINILDNVIEYDSCLSSDIEEVKPYLFPLESMSEEQKEEYYGTFSLSGDMSGTVDFYNKHHLDWRGLIPMGLAIDATNLNIY